MRILLVAALLQELGDAFRDVPALFTGVGKVNAAIALTKALTDARHAVMPDLVLNLGTAGCGSLPVGSLVQCVRFVQYDMDCSPIGFEKGETPFDELPEIIDFKTNAHIHDLCADNGTRPCHTADRFNTDKECSYALHDMEAYALAKVCARMGVPFTCVKYITDGANHQAKGDWQANLAKSGAALRVVYDRLKRELK